METEGMNFDFRTMIKDPKTGKEVERNDYASHFFKGKDGNTQQILERPIGSGNFFYPNGEPCEPDEELQSFIDKVNKKPEPKKVQKSQPQVKDAK